MKRFLLVTLQVVILALMVAILVQAASLESEYFFKYEQSHAQVEREQERQIIVSNIIRSQQAWEQSAASLRTAYTDERTNRIKCQRALEISRYEFYAFVKTLEYLHPGAADEVVERIGTPVFGGVFEGQPTPADPGTRPTIHLPPLESPTE